MNILARVCVCREHSCMRVLTRLLVFACAPISKASRILDHETSDGKYVVIFIEPISMSFGWKFVFILVFSLPRETAEMVWGMCEKQGFLVFPKYKQGSIRAISNTPIQTHTCFLPTCGTVLYQALAVAAAAAAPR